MEPKRSSKSQKAKVRGKTLKEPTIYFIDISVEELYTRLKESPKFEDKELYSNLTKSISKITIDPLCGVKVPKKLWPNEYSKYNITNLWKLDLPNGWRLIYTIEGSKISIISIIIEWFCHKKYEKKFKY